MCQQVKPNSLNFFCKCHEFNNPMTIDVGEFFSISNYNILTGFKPLKFLPFAVIHELRHEEGITAGLWEDVYGQYLSHGFSRSLSVTLCEIWNPTAEVYRHFCLLFLAEIGYTCKSSKTCMMILTLQTFHSFSKVQISKTRCFGNVFTYGWKSVIVFIFWESSERPWSFPLGASNLLDHFLITARPFG